MTDAAGRAVVQQSVLSDSADRLEKAQHAIGKLGDAQQRQDRQQQLAQLKEAQKQAEFALEQAEEVYTAAQWDAAGAFAMALAELAGGLLGTLGSGQPAVSSVQGCDVADCVVSVAKSA